MRKLFSLLLVAALLSCLSGCGNNKATPDTPANFYYCNKDIHFEGSNTVFTAEMRNITGLSDTASILRLFLEGPESDDLTSPFPKGVQISAVEEIGSTINVIFTPELSQLTGPDLMLACVCTAMTLFDLAQVETVIIKADGVLLDGRDSVMLTRDRLVFVDTLPPEEAE
jgi:germination protein M